jgi:exosortase/archaeosortase family protein
MHLPRRTDRAEPANPVATRPSLRFALSYAFVCAILFGAYFVFTFPYSGWPYSLFTLYLHLYAVTAGALLRALDPGVVVSGGQIVGRTSLAIVRGCDGSEAVILLAAAIFASHPYPWRLRLVGALAGAAALSAANVVRICFLYCVSLHAPSAMEFWHLEFWPLILCAFAIGFFVLWGRWASARQGVPAA